MKKKISVLGELAFSAALFWLAFRRADAGALAAVFASLALRGLKWCLLLAPAGRARFGDAVKIETAGLALPQ